MDAVEIYDTTLRDGAQSEDVSFSVEDKLRITVALDEFGIPFIEGGWPGSNPRDVDYFKEVRKLKLKTARIAAFGSTHRHGHPVYKDTNIKHLLEAETPVVTIVGKTWDLHVTEALKITFDDNLKLIHDSITYLKKHGKTVFFDAEHFYQGYLCNSEYSLKCIKAAEDAGADCIVLCETNGGCLPDDIRLITRDVRAKTAVKLGIHAHNDSDCAVANTLEAVLANVKQVQGTINGIGERCGNANLCSIIPNLQLKRKIRCIDDNKLKKLREISRFVTEIANQSHVKRQPFVGDSAFAHKGGIHVSAIRACSSTYEHISPESVGNTQRILVSDLAGKSTIMRKAEEFGLKIDDEASGLLHKLKTLENQGFQFEAAEASFEIMIKKMTGHYAEAFELLGFRVIVEKWGRDKDCLCEATVKLRLPAKANEDGTIVHTVSEGNGPVNALDKALRKALDKHYPELKSVKLLDYKVRVLQSGLGTATGVRVLIESGDDATKWSTVGVSENVIEASWQALLDSIEYKLLRESK
ncbi:MAG: citramalate synthase [Nitrospirae bacterium]|nr:citramalate synthase [Nitrospirota bacterium]MBF0534942.1 citramalate synthase [Nitrospirota bacterium]MBF0617207.1 citramalate synthase [Nitrospirota bacterium]